MNLTHRAALEKLADMAGEIAIKYFRKDELYGMGLKGGRSPLVTKADVEIETTLRAYIETHFPEHSIVGEERGIKDADVSNGGELYTWVIDPIDGTSAFACGKPTFVTLVALMKNGAPYMGLISQPILKERWFADDICVNVGAGAVFNGTTCKAGEADINGVIRLSCTTPLMFDEGSQLEKFNKLRSFAGVTSFSGDGYSYGLLANGHIDIIVEADLKIYDLAAVLPVVKGAGGFITDWDGGEITLYNFTGNVVATRGRALHEKALDILRS
ncbi:histidinol-phosphatase [Deferribacterales bacterium RsTz2092]|nr:histidinol-phosphatase [Deferribacterales bacterium]